VDFEKIKLCISFVLLTVMYNFVINFLIMKEKIHNILTKVNKPSRYIGQETGSYNKKWETADTRAVMAFPDLYEVGISNLGLRILYDKINSCKDYNFLADRVYAPDKDFKDELIKENVPLYGLESLKPLSEFDAVAFSLQYELSYPTLLAMLDLAKIPLKSKDRTENHPIIMAGGPGSYNPEPIAEFIDVFLIGDGESIIIEVMKEISSAKKQGLTREQVLKNISKYQGVYIPLFYNAENNSAPTPKTDEFPAKIKKRIDDIDNTDYPVNFPIPHSTAVHDRAVIEIRRGCGRMCRFCQACFVNFPVRERSPEKVIELADEVLKNTGYDEYSLLSLSSNDYKNIEKLVKILNQKHSCSGVSVSLPSQRADKFSLELAEEVQKVRKNTITIAPEAGSQRLRDVINKNLTEEQIIDAVSTVYKRGWSKIKLYFMFGLPTETYEDLDEIVNLLKKIRATSLKLKQELGLSRFLSVTCTMSIFVPKPFTPFQWSRQNSLAEIDEKVAYLRQHARNIRDVRLNFHDSFLCQLEAVFSRGDRSLNSYLEEVYRNGSYLDAWDEHFNKEIWISTAEKTGIDLEKQATAELNPEAPLVWDIFDTGVDKQWLIDDYKSALENQNNTPCDEKCNNCGVCSNFKTHPSIKSTQLDNQTVETKENSGIVYINSDKAFKYRLKLQKTGEMRFLSHLDWQKLIYGAIRKAGLKINFTQGFNPTPKFSLAVALPIFNESTGECADIELLEEISPELLMEKLNKFLPKNSKILKIVNISKDEISIEKAVYWAKYEAFADNTEKNKKLNLKSIVKNCLLEENIIIEKLSKKKVLKKVDIRSAIHSLTFEELNGQLKLEFILKAGQNREAQTVVSLDDKPDCRIDNSNTAVLKENLPLTAVEKLNSTLRADQFLNYLIPEIEWAITRKQILDFNFEELL